MPTFDVNHSLTIELLTVFAVCKEIDKTCYLKAIEQGGKTGDNTLEINMVSLTWVVMFAC